MREWTTWLVGVAVGVGLVSRATPVRAGGACSARVASNVYACTVVKSDGTSFKDCLRFATPGKVSAGFDVTPDQLGVALGCTCTAAGSKKKPKLAAGPTFECTAQDYAFAGTVSGNGKAISKGIAHLAAGASFAFTCKLDAACAL